MQIRTVRACYLFKVSEDGSGTCWISTEPVDGETPLEHRVLGFDLPSGTSFEKAREIADYLNRNLASVAMIVLDNSTSFQVDNLSAGCRSES